MFRCRETHKKVLSLSTQITTRFHMNYVILAGGLGSRFQKEGHMVPKPLVQLLGQPMIGRLIKTLCKFGAERIQVAANARMPQLLEYLDSLIAEGYPVVVNPVITDNSYVSLREGAKGIDGKFIAMTVDAIFTNEEFGRYVDAVARTDDNTILMGLTRFVDDESPLYARINADGEIIDYRYGGEPFAEGTIVSAGLYGLSGKAMQKIIDEDKSPKSLSDFQRILAAETNMTVLPFEFEKAFDVDNLHDRAAAEEFLRDANGE